MLDNPEKTARLLAALKAAVPFKVELVPSLVAYLRAQHVAIADQTQHIVSNLSYAGDEGGIVCHIAPADKEEALVVSLTQVRVPRSMPLAAAVADYHNHRGKEAEETTYGVRSNSLTGPVGPRQCRCGISEDGAECGGAAGRADCLAGHVGLKLRNVVAKYPFERPQDFR